MKVNTNVKSRAVDPNHNESLKIKTGVKAGALLQNHNEKMTSTKRPKALIVKTGVKAGIGPNDGAGGNSTNHNEKLTSDNNRSIEQKKTVGKKLQLRKETIRELRDGHLKMVAGGATPTTMNHMCEPPTP